MKATPKFFESLKRDDTDLVHIDLKAQAARYSRICNEMLNELIKRTSGAGEAFMILHFLIESLAESYGIEGGLISEGKDLGQS